jgi:hypothetical protein
MAKFDLAKTDLLMRLFEQPRETRDPAWRAAFLEAIVDASLASTPQQLIQGPDGFPYFVLQSPPVAQAFTPYCVAHVLEHCTNSGFGIVVEPKPEGPQWVFNYGELFSLRAYGEFGGEPVDRDAAKGPAIDLVKSETQIMVGAPSEHMLPSWARRVIAAFLTRSAHVAAPAVFVMMQPPPAPPRSLVFNLHPEAFPSHAAFTAAMNALSWYMPPHRSVVALSEKSSLNDAFVPLV